MRRLSGLVCALLFCAACSEPPQKELDMAQGAIDAARAAGAEQYAGEALAAAAASLQSAHDAVAQRDYVLALSRAVAAREQANEAAKRAADGKARTRSGSEAAIAAAATALLELQQRLKAAAAANIGANDLRAASHTARKADAVLQEARAAVENGNYLEAGTAVGATRNGISEAIRSLDEALAARAGRGARRRR
jgi:hypothetical protein